MLQLLSLTKYFSSKFESSMTSFHDKNVRMQNVPKIDKLKVSEGEYLRKYCLEVCFEKLAH